MSRSLPRLAVAFAFTFAFALSCALLMPARCQAMMAGASPDSPAARVDPVVTGSLWSGVVAIKIGGNVYSGVLVADRYVLTAAHVGEASVSNPASLEVQFNLAEGTSSIAASRVEVFPTYSFPYDDLSLIQLSAPAPEGAKRYAILDSTVTTGTVMKLVGYGASGTGDAGVTVGSSASIRRAGENVLDALQSAMDTSGRSSAFYLYDFDGPSGRGSMGTGTLGNARETMVAAGDSGSPAFVTKNDQYVLMGINNFAADFASGAAPSYKFGNGGGGMRLSDPRFISWLREKSGYAIHATSDPDAGDAPIPGWAGLLLAGSLLVGLRVHHAGRIRAKA